MQGMSVDMSVYRPEDQVDGIYEQVGILLTLALHHKLFDCFGLIMFLNLKQVIGP